MANSGCGGSAAPAGAGRVGFVQQSTQSQRGFLEMQTLSTGGCGDEGTAMGSSLPCTKCTRKLLEDPTPESPACPDREGYTQALKAARLPWTDPYFLLAMSFILHVCGGYSSPSTKQKSLLKSSECTSGREELPPGWVSSPRDGTGSRAPRRRASFEPQHHFSQNSQGGTGVFCDIPSVQSVSTW